MSALFIFISTCLAIISPLIYARAILKGEAKPHRTTRLVLLLITALATTSLLAQGDTVAVWLAGVSTFQSILIFGLSLKFGMGGWSRQDLVCLAIALGGIILWQTTQNPVLALYASIVADFTGMIPALIKTYHLPHTEIWAFYALDVLAAGFSLLAISEFSMKNVAYPLYILLINIVMVGLIVRPMGRSIEAST